MNEISKNEKTVLVLAYTKEDVINSLPLIREFKKNGSTVIVLGLDFYSWIELRKRNIPYKTPADYFEKEGCEKIDIEAIRLAHVWYKPIEDKITYHEICLGEMAEYHFAFLFIDALRSIEIANSVIDLEKPTEIWLPENIPMRRANTVRYEALPKAMAYLAKSKGIRVSYINSNFVYGNIKNKVTSIIKNIAIRTLYRIKGLRARTNEYSKYKNKAIFVDVPSEIFLPIKKELEKNQGNIAINISSPMIIDHGKILDTKVKELMKIWKNLKNEKIGNDLIYNNISLVDILTERFSQFFLDESLTLINYIEGTEKLIKNVKPDIAITMDDITPIHRVITRVCRTNGIPTLVIQHGITGADMKGFHVMPLEADKQAVWGDISKKWAIERGKSSETQVITGNPRYDLIVTMKNKSKKEKLAVYNKLGLNSRKGIVVIATQWYAGITSCYTPESHIDFISKTLEAMKGFPEKQVVVKIHPAYNTEYKEITRAIINELRIKNVIVTERFLWELLSICDLLITRTSTVGLEGMFFDKPVITFDPGGTPCLNPYAGTGAVIEIYEEENLAPAIKDALYDKEVRRKLAKARNRFVYEYAYLQDGKASQRVANLIEQMIEESKMNSCVVANRK